MSDIAMRLREHIDSDHVKGCDGRCYHCECGYDKEGDKLHAEAADEIERLQTALNGMQKAVSQLHEAVDAIERLGIAIIEEKP